MNCLIFGNWSTEKVFSTESALPKVKKDIHSSFAITLMQSLCKACVFIVRTLNRIKRYLNRDAEIIFVDALVSSKLDVCNSSRSNVTNKD